MKHKVKHVHFVGIGGARVSYPARDPRSGIDGKANAAGRRNRSDDVRAVLG